MQLRNTAIMIGITIFIEMASGCSSLRPDAQNSPEYKAAKNEIESYEDSEGNYIRPEGLKAEKKKGGVLGDGVKVPWPGTKPLDRTKAKDVYAEANALFQQASAAEGEERRELFHKAAKRYVLAAKYWPSSAHEQDAWLQSAESYFFAEEYPDAEEMYVKLLRNYPRTRHLDIIDKRRMEIAQYWIRYERSDPKPFYVLNMFDPKRPWNDTGNHGRRVLEKLRLDNPTGRLADDATMELATAAFEKGKYEEAANIYEDLRMTYPDSPHQFDAHFLGLKATLETYQGAEYDGQALDQAEALLKKMVRQFPEQSRKEQEYINRVYAEVRYKKAERLQYLAEYRMKRGENRAAVMYLDRLLAEYGDTPFSTQASEARDAIKDAEPLPEQQLKWLADLVPHNDKVSQIAREVEPIDVSDVPLEGDNIRSDTRMSEQPSPGDNPSRF